jgi:hypothetical protein
VDVNPVTEQDLELLEDYLDGALAPDESERLYARLAEEPALADALAEARAARQTRAAVWAALEPTADQASGLADRVMTTARQQERRSRRWQFSRFGAAAAACLAIGYFGGWLGHAGGNGAGDVTSDIGGATVVNHRIRVAPPVPAPTPTPTAETAGVLLSEIQFSDPPNPPVPMLAVSEVTAPRPPGGLQVGDVLLSVDGEQVPNVATLAATLASRRGDRRLRILRRGDVRELTVRVERQR